MVLLAEFLKTGIHPRLPREKAEAYAKAILDSAAALRNAYEEARQPLTELKQLEQVRRALATNAQSQLVALKRRYKAEQFSEAEIHTVIPDRPTSKKPGSDPKE